MGNWGEGKCIIEGRVGDPAGLVAMARRPDAGFAFEAVRFAIGAELRRLHSDILQEPIPARMAELLRQLDRPPKNGEDTDDP
jgi:Anti-sigma factor NepR